MQSFCYFRTKGTDIFLTSVEITRLIQRCRQGDTEALGALYESYAKRMSSVCRRYLSDKRAINDVLHDSFVIIFTSLDTLRDDSKAEAWMMSITRNVASKYKDFQKAHRTVAFDETSSNAPFDEEFQEEIKDISMDELMAMIDKLPEGYGKVFRLAVFEGLSHNEIAEMLNIEPHSSSSQLARAKKLLRKMIQQYWAVLLLLLIPITLLLLRKENSVADGETPVVVNHNDTPTTQPTEQNQEPAEVVQQPTQKTTNSTADTQRSAVANKTDYALIDTSTTMVAQDATTADTLLNGQPSDTIQFIQKMAETPYYDRANLFPEKINPKTNTNQLWAVGFAYTGGVAEQTIDMGMGAEDASVQGNASNASEEILQYDIKPITLALSFRYKQSRRFALESGVNYIRRVSEMRRIYRNYCSYKPTDVSHYLGLPIKGIYTMASGKRWSLYGNLGITMGIPVYSQVYVSGVTRSEAEKLDLTAPRAPWLWFPSAGLGVQCNITKHIGIYTEPSVKYYISTSDKIKHPFAFSLPLGIKFIW